MQNLYLVRTAAVVTIAAGLLGVGWIGMQGDEPRIAPEMVSIAAPAQTGFYFPADYVLQPNANEPEAFEYN